MVERHACRAGADRGVASLAATSAGAHAGGIRRLIASLITPTTGRSVLAAILATLPLPRARGSPAPPDRDGMLDRRLERIGHRAMAEPPRLGEPDRRDALRGPGPPPVAGSRLQRRRVALGHDEAVDRPRPARRLPPTASVVTTGTPACIASFMTRPHGSRSSSVVIEGNRGTASAPAPLAGPPGPQIRPSLRDGPAPPGEPRPAQASHCR